MNKLVIVFAVAALVAILTSACQHAGEELQDVLGCTLAGNGCDSVNPDDPNLVGPTGPQGPAGPPGERGPAGPGEEITFVQLCPGTPSYPSSFPETAICASGHLYAVFSVNGGYLTLLPEGRYSSNAVGSRCSFTVRANCVVVP